MYAVTRSNIVATFGDINHSQISTLDDTVLRHLFTAFLSKPSFKGYTIEPSSVEKARHPSVGWETYKFTATKDGRSARFQLEMNPAAAQAHIYRQNSGAGVGQS